MISSKLIAEIISKRLTPEERELVETLVIRFWDAHLKAGRR